ncbi:MAG: aldolase/citrate lyase family protein [Planctomycetota bacterium]
MKSLKKMLAKGETALGLMISELLRPSVVKIYAKAGADFLYMEFEHCLMNPRDLADVVLCATDNDLPVVAKTPYLDRAWVTKLLDAGVTGIQLPMTETSEQVRQLAEWVKFPPVGKRACACAYGATGYVDMEVRDFIEKSNAQTLVIAHVETLTGVKNIDAILDTGVVDVLFVGPFDLSISCGKPGDYESKDFKDAVRRLSDAAKKRGVVLGTYLPNAGAASRWRALGARFFELADELAFIAEGATRAIGQVRGKGNRR